MAERTWCAVFWGALGIQMCVLAILAIEVSGSYFAEFLLGLLAPPAFFGIVLVIAGLAGHGRLYRIRGAAYVISLLGRVAMFAMVFWYSLDAIPRIGIGAIALDLSLALAILLPHAMALFAAFRWYHAGSTPAQA